jgi:hypothetical protein
MIGGGRPLGNGETTCTVIPAFQRSCLRHKQLGLLDLEDKLEQSGPGSIADYRPCLAQLAAELLDRIRFSRFSDGFDQIDDTVRGEDRVG